MVENCVVHLMGLDEGLVILLPILARKLILTQLRLST